jgi:hypothetical protein
MRKFLIVALFATCLLVAGCGDQSSTAPRAKVSLAGRWVGTGKDITITMDVGKDTLCNRTLGFCSAPGSGTYARTDGSSGSFTLSVDYFLSYNRIAMDIGGFGTEAIVLFTGEFDSSSQLSGMLFESSVESSPLHVSVDGTSMTFVRQ